MSILTIRKKKKLQKTILNYCKAGITLWYSPTFYFTQINKFYSGTFDITYIMSKSATVCTSWQQNTGDYEEKKKGGGCFDLIF